MLFQTLKDGAKFAALWPNLPILNNVFKEGYIVRAVNFSKKALPPIIALFIVWYFCYIKFIYISYSSYVFFSAIFVISISLLTHMGLLYFLGKKAKAFLPKKTQNWYQDICKEIDTTANLNPTYLDLAKALNKVKQEQDKNKDKKFNFWEKL